MLRARLPRVLIAGACIDERRFVDALPHAERATRLLPDHRGAYWNLAVAAKHAGRWRECLTAADRVIALAPDDAEGAYWNAGIAATALGQWSRARAAWRGAGITVPDGEGPLNMGLGLSPVRVDPDGAAEVLWCQRLDPCRARITSVPLPDCDRGFSDVVLHDGEPRGRRQLGDRTVAVFDELVVLERSDFGTWEVTVDLASPEELAQLLTALGVGEGAAEETAEPSGWQVKRRIGVAARSEDALRPLRRLSLWWRKGVQSVERVR